MTIASDHDRLIANGWVFCETPAGRRYSYTKAFDCNGLILSDALTVQNIIDLWGKRP